MTLRLPYGWIWLVAAVSIPTANAAEPYPCRFTSEAITIDGQLDEKIWQAAPSAPTFRMPWQEGAPAAKATTQAKLVWDREYLYFSATLVDKDLIADITEHDGRLWHNDVFELFFQPDRKKPGYYEFQVNAAGAVLDVFFPKRSNDGFDKNKAVGDFHLDVKVKLEGTLNKPDDVDRAWHVEGRIPWHDLMRTGGRPAPGETWGYALCRYDYQTGVKPELSTLAPLKDGSFHAHEDYATIQFVEPSAADIAPLGANSQRLKLLKENWDKTSSRVVGRPDPPLPLTAQRFWPKLELSSPIYIEREPTSERMLIIEQTPSRLAITGKDPSEGNLETLWELPEKGVGYSVAFHPKYAENGFIYVGWNGLMADTVAQDPSDDKDAKDEKHSIVTRWTMDHSTGRFKEGSDQVVIHWESNGHNGAAVVFGHDGMLYITSGDGTSDSDTNLTGQGLDHLLAKVLRIDVDHVDAGAHYRVPGDNPFVGQKDVRPETWAYGLRNPWRIAADQKTGDIWVGNNGQDLWEQAYLIQRGANYGWSVYEGGHPFYANRKLGPTPHVPPTLEHPHSESRSLTGGVVYYGDRHPELEGVYVYGDYSTGKIWGAKVREGKVEFHRELADTALQISAFAVTRDGHLLVLDHRGGKQGGCYSLEPNNNAQPTNRFPRKLSETGLFDDVAHYKPHPGLIPYSVNSPLWSDGASKRRHLYLPPSDKDGKPTKINFQMQSAWDFPDGTVAVKSFGYDAEAGNPDSHRWLETRLLTKQQGEWVGYSYAWNDDQTDATLVDAKGRDVEYAVVKRSQEGNSTAVKRWRFPSRAECMVCHSRAAKYVLGLSGMQLNRVHDYEGARVNQLELLEWLGLLKINEKKDLQAAITRQLVAAGRSDAEAARRARQQPSPGQRRPAATHMMAQRGAEYPHLADPYDEQGDLTSRVRSYLHSNCAQCHVSAGGGNSQIQLDYRTELANAKMIGEKPLHDSFGLKQAAIVAPQAPDRSVLLHRLAIRGRGQMPQLSTYEVDRKAVELFRQWIESLPPQ